MPVVHKAQERIYLTADRKTAVGEGDTRAAFLYAAPGDEIPDSAAEALGIEAGKVKVKLKVKAETQQSVPAVVTTGREAKAKSPAKNNAKTGAKSDAKTVASAKEMKAPAEDKENKGGDDKGTEEKSGEPDSTKPTDGAGG